MAKTKSQKIEILNEYSSKIQKSKGFIVLKPKGLNPNESNDFRKDIYDFDSQFKIIKNSLFNRALEENSISLKLNEGEHAIVFLGEDIVSPSKKLKAFIENTKTKDGLEKIQIISGVYENEVLTSEQVAELSEMPDKQGSVSLILGILDNAISGVIYVLEDSPRSVVNVINQAFKE